MSKINIIKIIKKKFPFIKQKLSYSSDLINDGILDSLELMNLISHLEKTTKFKVKIYLKNNKKFIIKNIENFLN